MIRLLRSLLLSVLAGTAAVAAPVTAQSPPAELLPAFQWRNIGPSNMMGRISSIDALDSDYRVVLIGSASGGVWLSKNAGTTFEPIFDSYGSQSIGAVAFFQGNPQIIWVGTGEGTNRNSVGWGDGIYKSTDGGESFTRMGLEDTYQISEIAPHPTNPDIVYAAAVGQLWGTNGRRGLFKTTDGGQSWQELTNGLPDGERVGATDVNLDPTNPEIVYVGMYERLRQPWTMTSGGPSGGIFKSTDGGQSFRELTEGLPTGETGQIDIDIYRQDPRILVAYVEADENLPPDLGVPGSGIYRSEDAGESWTYIHRHTHRPYYHGQVRINPQDDQLIQVVARGAQYTTDGGKTWEEGKWYSSGGGDDHDAWISPERPEVVYSATDQGAHLQLADSAHISFTNMAIGQYYAIGVDMREPYWVYGGLQDNGGWAIPSRTRNRYGIRMDHAIEVNGGDGFHMEPDPTDWRTVYTTAHVGYFGRIDMLTREKEFITPTPETTVNFAEYYDPDFPETQIDYTINPEEAWLWRDIPNRTIDGSILPPQFRWNWNSPLAISPANPRTLYVGSSNLFKSTDRGETWRIISPDLTRNDPATRNSTGSGGLVRDVTGAENWNTIFAIAESPLDPSVVWVGTDDGYVQVTRDGGDTWTNVTGNIPGFPERGWVSRVEAGHHEAGTAYVTVDNHRLGDNQPYVWKTVDFGQTWSDLSADLPREIPGLTLHTVVEDPVNPDLLFLGTEFGVYMSLDGGESWQKFMNGLPPVAVRDLIIHPREADLVAGTHGRSIWIADDITPLRELTPEIRTEAVHLFDNTAATKWLDRTNYEMRTSLKFNGDNPPPGAAVSFWLGTAPRDSVEIQVMDPASGASRSWKVEAREGVNRARWNFLWDSPAEELEAYRQQLREIRDELYGRVETTPDTALLRTHRLDLLAHGRFPGLYEDFQYTNTADPRTLLLDHLRAVAEELDEASTMRHLSGLREQLLAFSPFVGDQAFFGFYGDQPAPAVADAGTYRVRLTVDGETDEASIRVREDPILTRTGTEGVGADVN